VYNTVIVKDKKMKRTTEEIRKESEEIDSRYWALSSGKGRKSKATKKRLEELATKSFELWKEEREGLCQD
jgi:hypothetical protein